MDYIHVNLSVVHSFLRLSRVIFLKGPLYPFFRMLYEPFAGLLHLKIIITNYYNYSHDNQVTNHL